MDSIEVLCEEHRAIWRALACIELAAKRLRAGKYVRFGLFADVANFIQGFADQLHHRKEMARRHLDTQQRADLAAAFALIDREVGGTREKYLDLLAGLEQELKSPSPINA